MKNLHSRRNFVKLAAAGTAGAFLFSNYSCSKKIPGIGLQLYTIRDAMTADPAGSLKKVRTARPIKRTLFSKFCDDLFPSHRLPV